MIVRGMKKNLMLSLWGGGGGGRVHISKSEIFLCTVGSESIPCSAAKVCPLGHAQLYKSCIT